LKVVPVIDILNGVVVHAVKGKRSEYKPLQSALSNSVDPVEVAKNFKMLGFSELYLADLDAIIDCSADFQVFQRIVGVTGLDLMVDAGVTSIERAERLLGSGVSRLVIGTETLQNKNFVAEAARTFGSDRVIVSLDLRGKNVLVKLGFKGSTDPLCLLNEFKAMGISQVIVLDLTRVGSGEGVNVDFIKKVLAGVPLDLYVGGGVRDLKDLFELNDAGVSGALVATALHSGKISIEDLKKNGFL
jgi:phosphoribosylformimino-5-aminoimidazole carboxamide ribotide isomerase